MIHWDSQGGENPFAHTLRSGLQPLPDIGLLTRNSLAPDSIQLQFRQEPPKPKLAELRRLRKDGFAFKSASCCGPAAHLDWRAESENDPTPKPTEPDEPED